VRQGEPANEQRAVIAGAERGCRRHAACHLVEGRGHASIKLVNLLDPIAEVEVVGVIEHDEFCTTTVAQHWSAFTMSALSLSNIIFMRRG
jgi:hypothetical protein